MSSRGRAASTLSLLAITVAQASTGFAQTKPEAAKTDAPTVLYQLAPEHSIFSFDYGAPTSPALSLLGLTTDKTPASTSLTKFVLSAPAVFGKTADQSVAFDFAPSAVWERKGADSFNTYVDPPAYFYRLQHRTRLNFALKNGNDNDDNTKDVASGLALGLSASLLDWSDPLMATDPKSGKPYLTSCLEHFTPVVMAVLNSSTKFDPDLSRAETAVEVFAEANIAIRNGQYDEARRLVAAYMPGAEDVAIATAAPAAPATPSALEEAKAAVRAFTEDPELKTRLGPGLADKLSLALRKIEEAQAGPTKTAVAAASAPALVATPPIAPPDNKKFADLVAEQTKVWEQKRDALLRAGEIKVSGTMDARFKSDFNQTGASAAFAACATRASQIARFSTDLDVGLGKLWNGRPGEVSHLTPRSNVVWAAFKMPLSVKYPNYNPDNPSKPGSDDVTHALMLVAYGRFGFDELIQTGDKTTPTAVADTKDAWIGLEWLHPAHRLTAQYGWVEVDTHDPTLKAFSKSGERYLLGSQWRLGDESSGLWLGASYGNGYGSAASLKATTALVTISYSPPAAPDIAKSK